MDSPFDAFDEYWDNGFDTGTAFTWEFDGADGVRRLSGPVALEVVPADTFSAVLTRVQLDHVALEDFQAAPHRAVRGEAEIAAFSTPLLTFVHVQDGRVRVELGGRVFTVWPGQYVALDSRDPYAYTVPVRTRLLRAVVGLEHLDERLRERGASLPGPLQRTPLTDGYIAVVSRILTTSASGRRLHGERLVHVVADLTSAVLAESQHILMEDDGPAALRYRAAQYVEGRHADADLTEATVARALEVSLPRLREVFDEGDRTLVRFIRDRRLAAVALELRAGPGGIDAEGLAVRYGFDGPDDLARAFRERFGMTLADYRDGGHRSLD